MRDFLTALETIAPLPPALRAAVRREAPPTQHRPAAATRVGGTPGVSY
ncbi:hypothetical protein [Hymenobacter arcticus]